MSALELYTLLGGYSGEELDAMNIYLDDEQMGITGLKPPVIDSDGDLIFECDL